MKKIIEIIGNTLVGIAIFLVVFLLLSTILPSFKYSLVVIRSGSMEPTISTGSVIVSKQQDDYSKGDIITFQDIGGTIITHRVTEVMSGSDTTQFKTKGDNNNAEDMLFVNKKSVLGKTIFSIPVLGYVISFAKTIPGIIIIFVIPATWIVFEEMKKIKKEIKNKKSTTTKQDEK